MVLPKDLENYQNLVSDTLDDIPALSMIKDNEFEKSKSRL
jgi:hypothetical protein